MKKLTIATLALMTTAGVAFAANKTDTAANPNGEHRGGKMMREHKKSDLPRGFEQLNLTDAQKAKIKAIVEANQPTAPKANRDDASFKQKMEARRAAEQKLMSNKTFDEAAARQMIVERQQERLQMEREHAERELQMLKKRHAIYQVLTPAQQKQLQELQQRRMENFENRKSK